jgi:hypothetical protein
MSTKFDIGIFLLKFHGKIKFWVKSMKNNSHYVGLCWSQWPRGLRNEMSSLPRTLGSWVRIPLEAWMSVCVYPVFVLGSGLAMGWSPVEGVLPKLKWNEAFHGCPMLQVGATGIEKECLYAIHRVSEEQFAKYLFKRDRKVVRKINHVMPTKFLFRKSYSFRHS